MMIHWISLAVFTLVYTVGELSHFLLGIVARSMSQELQYGDKGCLPNPSLSAEGSEVLKSATRECIKRNSPSCETDYLSSERNETLCVWDYSGLGLQYFILAGPAFIAVFTTVGILIGAAADRHNRKWILCACSAVLALATGITGFATSYWQLLFLRMLVGAGEGGYAPVMSSMIFSLFSATQRGLAMGIFKLGIYIGYGLSYATGDFVTEADIMGLGWRWSYIIAGILGAVAVLFLLILVREPAREPDASLTPLSEKETNGKKPEDNEEKEGSENGSSSSWITPRLKLIARTSRKPSLILLCISACFRHTAGFTWAYNSQLYFQIYHPETNLGLWMTLVVIVGGSLGVTLGGFVSDVAAKRLGHRSRLYVLACSQLVATPFAVGVLFLDPPAAFCALLIAYVFAEMWFGVLFAVLLQLLPGAVKSTMVAVFLFVMNNVGGNAPLLVSPLAELLGYRPALLLMYPGGYLISSIGFFLTALLISNKDEELRL